MLLQFDYLIPIAFSGSYFLWSTQYVFDWHHLAVQ